MKILKRFRNWIKEQLPATRKYTHIAVLAVQKLKLAVDSKYLTMFVQLTDNKVDDKLLAKLKIIVTEALYVLELADSITHSPLTQAQHILTPMNKEDRGKKYKELAGIVLSKLSGIDPTAAEELTDTYYKGEFVFYKLTTTLTVNQREKI